MSIVQRACHIDDSASNPDETLSREPNRQPVDLSSGIRVLTPRVELLSPRQGLEAPKHRVGFQHVNGGKVEQRPRWLAVFPAIITSGNYGPLFYDWEKTQSGIQDADNSGV
jgi:hypothetical protein